MARRLIALLAIAACAGTSASAASAAAPRYIMVSGGGIAKPILLANWNENLRFETAVLLAPKAERPARLPVQSRLTLSLFWGWEHPPKKPSLANQRGWLYPASASRPALIDAGGEKWREACREEPAALLRHPQHDFLELILEAQAGLQATRCSDVITWSQAALSCSACAGSQKHAIEYSVCPRKAKA